MYNRQQAMMKGRQTSRKRMEAPVVRTIRPSTRTPMPAKACERFFLLVWDRETGRYTIHTDDADRSSYDLGEDVQQIMRQFALWDMKEFGCRCVDLAREFGSVQGIPAQDRTVIRPGQRKQPTAILDFKDGDDASSGYASLPRL